LCPYGSNSPIFHYAPPQSACCSFSSLPGGLLNLDIEGSSEFTENQENYSKILRYIKNVLPCDDFDIMLRAADVFGKLFVYGDPTIVESVIEFEIQRLLDFMSRETAKSTEAERFGGLVGLNAFAGSVADMFLGYVDNVLRGLTVPLCDTRVGAPSSMIFWEVVLIALLHAAPHTQASWYPPWHLHQHPTPGLGRLTRFISRAHSRLRAQRPAFSRRNL